MNILIIGAGNVGRHLAKVLSHEGHNVIVIEPDAEKCEQMQSQLDVMAIQGHGTNVHTLLEAGIQNTDMLIAITGVDEINIMACAIAQKYDVKRKIARIRYPRFFSKKPVLDLEQFGVDVAIHPEAETAKEIVLLAKRAAATDIVEFANGRMQLVGVKIDRESPILGKSVQELSLSCPEPTFRVVAIFRNNRTIIPTGEDRYAPQDQIFLLAETEDIPRVLTLVGKSVEKFERAMILGGGRIGRITANLLESEKGVEIKLIESNPNKTFSLADELHRTLIIQGDGRDIDTLATEGIMETDSFIAATNDEETNILTCLLAKHIGVTKTIALVNREEYLSIMAPIGIDSAVNTNIITSNTILRMIRRGGVLSMASLPGIDAVIVEYDAQPGSKITSKPLSALKFPKDAIVGAITRKNLVLVPTGDTQINSGDDIIVFALPKALHDVEKLFVT